MVPATWFETPPARLLTMRGEVRMGKGGQERSLILRRAATPVSKDEADSRIVANLQTGVQITHLGPRRASA